MYLGLRTDSPVAEMYLYDREGLVAQKSWQGDRQMATGLLSQLEVFLQENNADFTTLNGVFVYRGPGSFTGLRIGITVINTIAYARSIGLVGEDGEDWCERALKRLAAGDTDEVVLPLYGAEARITKPKK